MRKDFREEVEEEAAFVCGGMGVLKCRWAELGGMGQ